MAATPTTKSQVQAYRFILRRMEHALVRKDAVMLHDPMRTQVRATVVGLVLAIIGLAGFALFALFRPAGGLGDQAIVTVKDSAATYVRLEGVLHPVLNLASARLVVGQAVAPSEVSAAALADLPRGPLLGIPGAPALLPGEDARPEATWTVCDTLSTDATARSASQQASATTTTTVIAGSVTAPPVPADGALLVQGPPEPGFVEGATYLVQDGRRARIDLADKRVTRALELDGATARPMSAAVLNAIPAVGQLSPPTVPGAGVRPSFAGVDALPASAVVGTVLQVSSGADQQSYVVLADGVQSVSPVVARLLQYASSGDPVTVSSSAMGVPPTAQTTLAVDDLPSRMPALVQADTAPVACMSWDGTGTEPQPAAAGAAPHTLKPTVRVGDSLPVPTGAQVVPLAQADGPGPQLDSVYLRPGQGALVRAVSPGTDVGELFLVSDTGVRYGIPNVETAQVLGLGSRVDLAPKQVLALLPIGPELSQQAALLAHDGLAGDPSPSAVPLPGD
ncbi:type VII secretion protein EccB [Rhodococcus sp. X156]|uniref:type VII secretion protein EccB n=1 Tax=Rhodococcus sp. X156 TaxID=2499145 RepID=UPI000FDAE36B|nr:type VII secretion protein EccB [Rhodococcus sp. X156]